MHFQDFSCDKNAKRVRDIFHKKQFFLMNSYRFFVNFVNIFLINSFTISYNQIKLYNCSFFQKRLQWYFVDAYNDLINDNTKINRNLRELNKKTLTHEFKTYRNTSNFLLKTSVANDIRDMTIINWYTTTWNTIRTIVVFYIKLFVVIVVHHSARIAREFVNFRDD
jgi:hypothetical protein